VLPLVSAPLHSPLLILPGYRGSGTDHWQSWLQTQVPTATRIAGIDWDKPILAHWAERVRDALANTPQPLTIVAHSFGCLAAVVAAADRPDQVADLILVAPADPDRFDFTGLKPPAALDDERFNLTRALPLRTLQVPGLMITSSNDPWLTAGQARTLAAGWQLPLHELGAAGHINADSGYGPWPWLLDLLTQRTPLQTAGQASSASPPLKKGRGSALAAVRQLTRAQVEKPHTRRPPGRTPI
jgi:uncharacterized protein